MTIRATFPFLLAPLGLLTLAMGLPTTLPGQTPADAKPSDRVVITASPVSPDPASKPKKIIVRELVISKTSDRSMYKIVQDYVQTGTHIPSVLNYYKGYATLSGPQHIPVSVVTYEGGAYAVLHTQGAPKIVRLGIARP